ncbi:NAD-dependent malic enzyme [Diplonema papillatum]|nr:NAD-dependent malic enzyme [Diplonema papillatum]
MPFLNERHRAYCAPVKDHRDDNCKHPLSRLHGIDGVSVQQWSDRTFLMHLGGKISTGVKFPLKTRDDLSMAYTPGVARVCMAIHENPEKSRNLTIKKNTIAVVSDGTAVLGLGDIGPEAAMPVMEGKAMLFKEFANVDAFPLCLNTKDPEEIIAIVKALEPTFGGINLEDISSPRCFEIERRLQEEMNIPVFHDDQHGTAVVCTAAMINCLKLINKKPEDLKVIILGVGAAGTACTNMMLMLGIRNIIGVDRHGALTVDSENMNDAKRAYAEKTNPNKETGTLQDVIKGADLFIGLAGPGLLTMEDIKSMAPDPVVFAMSNPEPEIMPMDAVDAGALIVATGRSDFPNQINNVLCFPGIFRGALDVSATRINEEMKMAAAHAIADSIPSEALGPDYIIPSVFDRNVAHNVARAVAQAARDSGVALAAGEYTYSQRGSMREVRYS